MVTVTRNKSDETLGSMGRTEGVPSDIGYTTEAGLRAGKIIIKGPVILCSGPSLKIS